MLISLVFFWCYIRCGEGLVVGAISWVWYYALENHSSSNTLDDLKGTIGIFRGTLEITEALVLVITLRRKVGVGKKGI